MNTKINRKNKWLAGLSFIICNLSFSVALTSCDENFDDWAAPQANGPENAITVPGFAASAVGAQDLAKAGDAVPMFTLNIPALPEGFEAGNARVELTPKGIDDPTTTIIKTTLDGTAPKVTLQELIEATYGKRPTARLFNAHVLVNAIKDGQAVFIDAGNVEVSITPEAPYIAPAYFIVGGAQDWAGSAASKEQRFKHSDADVYEDPIFTIVIDAAASGDTWFAIGDEAALDAITNDSDWTKLMGCVSGDNTATSGSLDYRYNMGADNSFCVKEGPKKIKVTINMIEYTYEITPVNIADNYYLIGGPGAWDSSKNQKFSHSAKDVFDDPVFTYTFEGTGSDMWFAFGDDEAIDAVGNGTWNILFGTTGASEDLSGSFDSRYNLDGDHSFHVDGKAKLYRFEVNMAEMTYEIAALDFDPYVYFIGATDGWANAEQKLALTDEGDRALLAELEKEAARTPLTEPLSYRPAEEADMPALMEIVAQAQAGLKKHRVDQWQDGYPREENLRFDMERGECFAVLHGEELAGFFTLSTREEKTYDAITDGKWTEGMAYCVLHRAAVSRKYRGSGLAAELMKCVERQARAYGLRCIRTDTHRKNKPMQTLLRESGYRYRGNITVLVNEGHDPARQGYEKILKK